MPFVSGGLIFNRKPAGNNVWGIVLEKAFAKINGNYENINFGYQAESFRILTGAPASYFKMSTYYYNTVKIWDIIADANAKNLLVGVDTAGST
jgi:hypothetical protein